MPIQVQIAKWGNSPGLRVSRDIAARAGLTSGVMLVGRVRSIDREARKLEIVGRAPAPVLDDIDARLAPLLSL